MRVLFVSLAAAFYLHPPVAPPANHPAWTVQGPAPMVTPVSFRGTRASMLRMQLWSQTKDTDKGIAQVLGGGKSKDDVMANKTTDTVTLAATVIMFLGIVFGALNPSFVENIAKSYPREPAVCVEGKIVAGKRTVCNTA